MSHIAKRAEKLIETYGTVGNINRLTKELKTLKRAEKDLYLASKNITKILKKKSLVKFK